MKRILILLFFTTLCYSEIHSQIDTNRIYINRTYKLVLDSWAIRHPFTGVVVSEFLYLLNDTVILSTIFRLHGFDEVYLYKKNDSNYSIVNFDQYVRIVNILDTDTSKEKGQLSIGRDCKGFKDSSHLKSILNELQSYYSSEDIQQKFAYFKNISCCYLIETNRNIDIGRFMPFSDLNFEYKMKVAEKYNSFKEKIECKNWIIQR